MLGVPSSRPRAARDEQGVVLSTRVLALCVSAVAVAGLVFVANDPDAPASEKARAVQSPPSATPSASSTPVPSPTPSVSAKPKPKPVKRGDTYVVLYNNTRVKGLAGGAAGKAAAAGWNVVGSDNWYGTVEASTIYYPPRLKKAAQELGYDLGIKKLQPAQEPMQFDRLTVILTEDYL